MDYGEVPWCWHWPDHIPLNHIQGCKMMLPQKKIFFNNKVQNDCHTVKCTMITVGINPIKSN